jgi:membrane protein
MSVIILFGAILAIVFTIAFVSSRRFGPLALSLAAGFLLSEWWASWLTGLLDGLKLAVSWLPNGVIAALTLTLIPLFALLLGGPRYQRKHEKIISAVAIAFLTASLLVVPLGKYVSLDGQALDLYKIFANNWRYIATLGLVCGVIDLFMLHTGGHKPGKH